MSIPENISTENVFEEIYGNKSSYILSFKGICITLVFCNNIPHNSIYFSQASKLYSIHINCKSYKLNCLKLVFGYFHPVSLQYIKN